MWYHLLSITIAAAFNGVHLVLAYAIFTTTIFSVDSQDAIPTIQATSIPQASPTAAVTQPALSPISNTSTVSVTNNATLPTLPLNDNQSDALTSFLNLLTSIPDNLLSAGEDGVKDFFANISSCVSGDSGALEDTIASQLPKLSSLTHEVEGKLTSAVGAVPSIVKSEASKATSLAGIGASVVASKVSQAVPKATSILGDIGHDLGFKRADASDILKEVGQVTACLSNAVTSNPIFEVGKCAADLVSVAIPAANLLRLKQLTGVVGGAVKAVETLKNATSLEDVVKGGGNALVDLLKGVADVTGAATDCAFLVQGN